MYLTPSPSASSLSGPFSPSLSDEGETPNSPYLRIVEQPVSKFRFRYRSEMQGAHGSLLGRGETSKKRTYPTVELVNFDGEAYVRCLLYTSDSEPTPHMHQLIAKENSKEVLDHEIIVSERNGYRAEFKGLGIVHMSKKDLKKELIRKKEKFLLEEMKRDDDLVRLGDDRLLAILKDKTPEFEIMAAKDAEKMDPNKVKLCFQAFLKGPLGQVHHVCEEIFSDTIQNMKSAETGELKICRMDRVAGSCLGGDEIYILVEKVCKKNIQVRFFELNDQEQEVWTDLGLFTEHDVHHQYAIVLRTPQYKTTDIRDNVQVKVELVRPKDNARSETITFTYKPLRRLAKRVHNPYSSSDSATSSFEGPKRCRQPGLSSDDGRMLSGSEKSSSLNFASEDILQVIKELQFSDDPQVPDFEKFLNSPHFTSYSESFLEGDGLKSLEIIEHSGAVDTPEDLPIEMEHEMDFGVNALIDSIVTDGARTQMVIKQNKLHRPSTAGSEKQKEDTSGFAKTAYSKLLKLMKSRHPSRLQDMKNIIRSEEKEYGPLHAAVLHGQLKELSGLLSLIIKSNLLKLINTTNQRKMTPLMVAVEENKVDCLKLLCMAKADLNEADYKDNTAIHIAAENMNTDCLKVLLSVRRTKEAGESIDLDRKNERGETALHVAIIRKSLPCVKLLTAAGADLNARTSTSGQTPLHLAVQFDCKEIVHFLLCQPSIKLTEVNFNNKKAQDLVTPNQKYILSLFKMVFEEGIDKTCEEEIDDIKNSNDSEEEEDEGEEDNDGDSEEEEKSQEGDEGEDEDEDEFEDADGNGFDDDEEYKLEIDLDDELEEDEDHKMDMVESTQAASKLVGKRQDIKKRQVSGIGDLSLLDQATKDMVASNLDKDGRWKRLCQSFKCEFLIETLSAVGRPTQCLLTYLEFDKKVTLSDFKDAIAKLNLPQVVESLEKLIKNK